MCELVGINYTSNYSDNLSSTDTRRFFSDKTLFSSKLNFPTNVMTHNIDNFCSQHASAPLLGQGLSFSYSHSMLPSFVGRGLFCSQHASASNIEAGAIHNQKQFKNKLNNGSQ